MPGLVSTLLNHLYSAPARLVHTFLQGMLQVWQPMHLSRFMTIAIWALILIPVHLPGPSHNDDLIALRSRGSVIVEPVAELCIAPDHLGGFHQNMGQAVVGSSALP